MPSYDIKLTLDYPITKKLKIAVFQKSLSVLRGPSMCLKYEKRRYY